MWAFCGGVTGSGNPAGATWNWNSSQDRDNVDSPGSAFSHYHSALVPVTCIPHGAAGASGCTHIVLGETLAGAR